MTVGLLIASEPAKEVQPPTPPASLLPTVAPLASWNGQGRGLAVARGPRLT